MRCASTPPSQELNLESAARKSGHHARPEELTTLGHPTHAEVAEADSFKHALVLNPWTEPIAPAGRSQALTRPLFVINSEAFSVWQKNFDPLRGLVQQAARGNESEEGWLLTLTKTRHTDFSDYPFVLKMLFGSEVKAAECLRVFAGVSVHQIAARATASSGATKQGRSEGDGDGELTIYGDEEPLSKFTPSDPSSEPTTDFWARIDALMNADGNELYRASDKTKSKSKYSGCVQKTRLRVEYEGETAQKRFGRPWPGKAVQANGHGNANGHATIKGTKDGEEPYGNERPGVLVIHPLGTPGSCPPSLLGNGKQGSALPDDDVDRVLSPPQQKEPSAVGPATPAPIRRLSASIRAPSMTLTKERQLSQDDRTPRRKNSRLEP